MPEDPVQQLAPFRERLHGFLAAQPDITVDVSRYDDIDLGRFVKRMIGACNSVSQGRRCVFGLGHEPPHSDGLNPWDDTEHGLPVYDSVDEMFDAIEAAPEERSNATDSDAEPMPAPTDQRTIDLMDENARLREERNEWMQDATVWRTEHDVIRGMYSKLIDERIAADGPEDGLSPTTLDTKPHNDQKGEQ